MRGPRTDPRALPRAHARRDRLGRGVAGVPRPRPARAERDPRRRGARRSAPARPWIALLIAVGVVSFVANYGRRRLGGRAAVDVQRDLQVAVHHHMQYLDPARRDQLRAGDIMSRATSDITLIQVFLQQLAMSIGSLALLASSLVIMVFLSPLLAVVVGVCVPLFAWLSNRFRTRSFPASWMDQRYQGAVAGVVEEAVTGVRIVKAFGQEQARARPAHRHGDHAVPLADAHRRASPPATPRRCRPSRRSGNWASSPSAAGWRSRGRSRSACSSPSPATSCSSSRRCGCSPPSPPPASRRGRVPTACSSCSTVQPAVRDAPDARAVTDPRGALDVDGVTFAYGTGRPVLDDVSFSVAPGERVAIVGGSGSGKSTLALLLARFYDPDGGAVRLDGHDVALRSRSTRCAARSASCSRRASCSPPRSATTSPSRAPTPPTPRCEGPPRSPTPTASSSSSPTATTPWSASAASRCRAGSASASPWPGPRWPTRRCSCSTTPRRPSTRGPRRPSTARSRTSSPIAPPSSSPTARRRCASPIGCIAARRRPDRRRRDRSTS